MKRIVLLLFMSCAFSSFTMADRIDANLTPVKQRHHHQQHHAHGAPKHHTQHSRHASV